MRGLVAILICGAFASCLGTRWNTAYINWDNNRDGHLNRYEFANGYVQSNFFRKWNNDGDEISSQTFLKNIFQEMDGDGDGVVDRQEFNFKIGLYCDTQEEPNFHQWDENDNSSITEGEFITHGLKKIIPVWDITGDGAISDIELARGMFTRCDLDNNGSVGALELAIWAENR